jgi:type I restriction enzyme S subunit
MDVEQLFGPPPDGWNYTTLGEACQRGGGDIQTGPFGSQLHASDYVMSGIPSIMPQNIGDNRIVEDGIARITIDDAKRLERYLVKKGDIVYSRRGDVERRALVRDHEAGWLCGTGCLRVRLGDGGVDPRYAAFFLGHPNVREWIVRHAHGATMPNLNTAILSACPLLIPPAAHQLAIANILTALEDKIEVNRCTNETLDAMALALFKSWFVDFDPVRAKVAGRDPGLKKSIADLFPASFENSELGETPTGWKVAPLGDILELSYGKALKEENRQAGTVPVFGSNGQVGWHNEKLAEGPGIIVGRKGNPGVVTWSPTDFFAIDTTFFVVPKSKSSSLYFLYHALRQHDLASLGADSAVPGLNRNMVYMSKQLDPPEPILAAFDRYIQPLFVRREEGEKQSSLIGSLRDTLLSKLISGQLRVENPARFIDGSD